MLETNDKVQVNADQPFTGKVTRAFKRTCNIRRDDTGKVLVNVPNHIVRVTESFTLAKWNDEIRTMRERTLFEIATWDATLDIGKLRTEATTRGNVWLYDIRDAAKKLAAYR